MLLESIEVHNFRNLSGNISWGAGFNIIHGRNGQGKTNWLEAIFTLARSKSFRTPQLPEAIRFGEESGMIRGRVRHSAEITRELCVALHGRTKAIFVNEKREPLARYMSQLQVIAFTADELEVVRGMPDARRRFIDRGVASLQPAFVQTLIDYGRVLKQKNRILRDAADGLYASDETGDLLEPWNQQLVLLAGRIHRARASYVERLNQVLDQKVFGHEEVTLSYVSTLQEHGELNDYEALLGERLRLRFPAEVASGHALIGPHRDDLAILFDGREMRAFGSSGQQRSALLLLDLAAISMYNSTHHDYPVLLVDDVDAELDEKRIQSLLEYLDGRIQTFVTTSKRSHLGQSLSSANVYEIENGAVADFERGVTSAGAAFSTP